MEIYNQYINFSTKNSVKLNSNEAFIDIDENIRMEIKNALNTMEFNRYPLNDLNEIKKLYAKYANVRLENIIVGNGSDELLELVIGKIITYDKKVLTLGPDFVMYDFFTNRFKGNIIKYNIKENLKFNVNKFIEFGKKENVDLIVFSNPNNPTGVAISEKEIVKILNAFNDKPVIVDEAYYEFNGESVVSYINEYKNLIVTRTLSKAWGLAAIRIGFLIADEERILSLMNEKIPYTISSFSKIVAEIVLRYPDKPVKNAKIIAEQRESLYEQLKNIQKEAALHIEFFKSKSNYIYGKTKHKEILLKGLDCSGIYIRNFDDDGFRITVGSPRQNKELIEALKKIFVYKN
ncbi:MAG: aminotransferase class I/II-fold pyridoxal phosphate-dependent enzyme [Clostridium butyricum]|nr:aminotransferase class I/II-fold pyridoxal phosphate-dependent enzyme [Clostridium butyricum]